MNSSFKQKQFTKTTNVSISQILFGTIYNNLYVGGSVDSSLYKPLPTVYFWTTTEIAILHRNKKLNQQINVS